MTLFHLGEEPCRSQPIPEHAEAAAQLFASVAKRIRDEQDVSGVIQRMNLIAVVVALSGRI